MGGAVYMHGGITIFRDVRFLGNMARGGNGGNTHAGGTNVTGGVGGLPAGGLGGSGGVGGTGSLGGGGGSGTAGGFGGGGGGGNPPGSGGPLDASQHAGRGRTGFTTPSPTGAGGGLGVGLGGAIFVDAGTLTIERCAFERNRAVRRQPGTNNDRRSTTNTDRSLGAAVYARTPIVVVDDARLGVNENANRSSHHPYSSHDANSLNDGRSDWVFAFSAPDTIYTNSTSVTAQSRPQMDTSGEPRFNMRPRNENNETDSDYGWNTRRIHARPHLRCDSDQPIDISAV